VLIRGVYGAEDIEVDLMFLQKLEAAHHLIERTSAAFVHAINIVQVLRPIDTQANKEIVLLEKSTPFVIE